MTALKSFLGSLFKGTQASVVCLLPLLPNTHVPTIVLNHYFQTSLATLHRNPSIIVLSCSVASDSASSWTATRNHQVPRSMGILQARILEWVAMSSFPGGSSQPKNQTQVSLIAGRFVTVCATKEAQGYWSG